MVPSEDRFFEISIIEFSAIGLILVMLFRSSTFSLTSKTDAVFSKNDETEGVNDGNSSSLRSSNSAIG